MAIRRTSDKLIFVVLAWLLLEHFFEHYGCSTALEFFNMSKDTLKNLVL
jgi:hypothetical protein